MIIRNGGQLGITRERKKALRILEAGYEALRMPHVLRDRITRVREILCVNGVYIDLTQFRRIGILGIGKCALQTGEYLEKLFGNRIYGGIICDVQRKKLTRLQSFVGDHPIPSIRNQEITQRMIAFAQSLDPKQDLLVMIISGGGSSLFFAPDGINAKDMIRLTHDLHSSGASIHELNCVRKHLSAVQGGKFAKLVYPLQTIALYFSDVICGVDEENMRTIASGPLYLDNKTNADAIRILKKYNLWNIYKSKVKHFSETPKNANYFKNILPFLVLTNITALEAMKRQAGKMGLQAKIVTNTFTGYAYNAYQRMKKQIGIDYARYNVFIAGGETSVKVMGNGKGGRNQEAALGALSHVKHNEIFVSAASDGIDNTEYAGGIADTYVKQRAESSGLDPKQYLARNDSYHFFKKAGGYIKTGFTGNNVADMFLLVKNNKKK